MTSADKLGMIVAVAVVVIFVGIGVGMSNVSENNARPDIDQQRAVIITEEFMKPKVGPGVSIDTGGYGPGDSETCSTEPAPPPRPGVNWDYCDISGNDYSGEDLSGATMIGTTADGTNFEDADLTDVVATNGIFTYARFNSADISNGDFSDSNLGRALFSNSNVEGTIFDGADLSGTNISRADAPNASFDDVKFEWAARIMPMIADHKGSIGDASNFEVSNSQFHMVGRDSNFEDTTFTNNVLWTFWIHSSSISNVDFSTQVVNTGHFSISDEEISLMGNAPGGFQYNADSNLECSEHVICDDPDPRLIRTGLLSVIPHPEMTEQVTIGGPLWVGPTDGYGDHDWSDCYIGNIICYYPQVATILKGGTVTWFNHDAIEGGHQLVSGKPSTGHDGMWKSPVILPGEEWSKIFPAPGKYHYYDILNPEWVGQVIVFGKGSGGPGDPNDPNYPPKDPQDNPKYSIKSGMQQQGIDKNIDKSPKLIPKDFPAPKDKPIKTSEYCWVIDPFTGEKVKDGIDNDGDGWIDEPDPLRHMPLGPHPGVDWDYCDLSMVDRLDGRVPTTADEIRLFDFTDRDLSEATIRHATAKGTIFTNTNLENAQFGHLPSDYTLTHPHTDATGAIFSYSKGDHVQFTRVTLNNANFDNARMMFAVFDFAGMEEVSMRHAYMPESSLIWATVIHSDLQNVNLKYSDMTHVNLESTDLSNAMLAQVTFDDGLLVDAWFTNAYMDESTLRNVDGSAGYEIDRISKYDDASMKEVIICNSNFDDATFEDADLTNSVFNDCAHGDEISFLGTNLHNAEFEGVFIPSPPSFPSMIDGYSDISSVSTDKSCLHHPYCDLEPPGESGFEDTAVEDTAVEDTAVEDTAVEDTAVEEICWGIDEFGNRIRIDCLEVDGEHLYEVDGELFPVHTGELVQLILFAEGSGSPGCELTEDGCFLPSTFVKEVGLSILWPNSDSAAHTVTSGSPADGLDGYFDSGLIMAGDSFGFPFEEEGIFDYFCMVHPWMSGTVIIVPETPDD